MALNTEFYETLTAAINDLMEHGYDSQQRLDTWTERLQIAARRALVPEDILVRSLGDMLRTTFKRATDPKAVIKRNPGISAFKLAQIQPRLHAELNRRILASASLIKLNREASVARTLQRFSGWASSVPAGGTEVGKRKEVKATVRKGIAALPFEERRVIIDQGHKLNAAVNDIIATDGGAIAGEWRHVMEGPPAYQSRPDHVARDNKIYLIKGSWAHKDGYVKPQAGHEPYTEDITQPGEEVFCRCSYRYIYNLRDLPPAMLTARGKEALLAARRTVKGVVNA